MYIIYIYIYNMYIYIYNIYIYNYSVTYIGVRAGRSFLGFKG